MKPSALDQPWMVHGGIAWLVEPVTVAPSVHVVVHPPGLPNRHQVILVIMQRHRRSTSGPRCRAGSTARATPERRKGSIAPAVGRAGSCTPGPGKLCSIKLAYDSLIAAHDISPVNC